MLGSYRWTPPGKQQPNLTYHFCTRCGVRTHAAGMAPGGAATVAVQIGTIEDVSDRRMLAEGIGWVDGLHDRFDQPPEEDVRAL